MGKNLEMMLYENWLKVVGAFPEEEKTQGRYDSWLQVFNELFPGQGIKSVLLFLKEENKEYWVKIAKRQSRTMREMGGSHFRLKEGKGISVSFHQSMRIKKKWRY